MSTVLPEKELLKSMLSSIENVKIAVESVKDHYFSLPQSLNLFILIKYHFEKTKGTAVLTGPDLTSYFSEAQRLTDTDKQNISQLFVELDLMGSPPHISVIIDTMIHAYQQREMAKIYDKGLALAKDNKLTESMDWVISGFSAIKDETLRKNGMSGELSDLMDAHLQTMREEVAHPELFVGLPLGFPTFDKQFGGLKKGTLTILYSNMKMGKSLLLAYIARSVGSIGKNVLIHLNEGGAGLLLNRLVCFENPVTQSIIRDREISQEDINRFEQVLKNVPYRSHIYIDDQSSVNSSISRLRNLIKTRLLIAPLDLVVIDMMTNMDAEVKGKDRYEELGFIAQSLKDVAVEFGIAIITSMHVNTEGQKSSGDTYSITTLGLSKEPAKHADNMLSWRIINHEDFLIENKGTGYLMMTIARNASNVKQEIAINTATISIQEVSHDMHIRPGATNGK